jgi:hypothetical protein
MSFDWVPAICGASAAKHPRSTPRQYIRLNILRLNWNLQALIQKTGVEKAITIVPRGGRLPASAARFLDFSASSESLKRSL